MGIKKARGRFVIFAHSGTYDKLHQVATIALTAAAMGSEVTIILFFWALKKFYSGQLDKADFPMEYQSWSHKITQLMKEKNVPPISEMFLEARGMGTRIIVCSAGLEYMGIDQETREEREKDMIDDIWGLPRVLTLVEGAGTVLYI